MTPPKVNWQSILEQNAPRLFRQAQEMTETALADGALSAKTKTLMVMLCNALASHPGGVTANAKRARALGATEEEIAETLEVAFLVGGRLALFTGTYAFREPE